MANKAINASGVTYLVNKIKTHFVSTADTQTVTSIGIDSTPTSGSTNLVTSGGVYEAIGEIETAINEIRGV